MGADAIAALIFGRLFDKIAVSIMIVIAILSSIFIPLVFLGGMSLALIAKALWDVWYWAQESMMRATIAEMSLIKRRGAAYGVFNIVYRVFWFMGNIDGIFI